MANYVLLLTLLLGPRITLYVIFFVFCVTKLLNNYFVSGERIHTFQTDIYVDPYKNKEVLFSRSFHIIWRTEHTYWKWNLEFNETLHRRELEWIVSPSAKIATWRYWFRLSHDVYDGNRSFASYTNSKTVESDVWCLLTRLDGGEWSTGSKYLSTVQDQNSSFSFKYN